MKKQFLNLGKALSKTEQKLITGGRLPITPGDDDGVGGGGGGSDPEVGYCYIGGQWWQFSCDTLCPNGTDPICPN